MFRPSLIAAALVATVAAAAPAFADQDARLRFIADVQAKAAWSGVEVERIVRANDQLTIIGTDRSGRQVTLAASCSNKRIACPVTPGPIATTVIAN